MSKIRLGVNIDHVATIRNARGEKYPEPVKAALLTQKCGADSITIHLREDRRHIREIDLKLIKKKIKIPINLEIAATNEMVNIALKYLPNFVCIVPEKRKELTTEGGLNLNYNSRLLKKFIYKLKKKNIRVSLFIEPNINNISKSKNLGADCVELHTGKFCSLVNKNKNYKIIIKKITETSKFAKKIGLEVHAGHGLTYKSAKILKKVKNIKEFNIGHFLISDSIFIGLKKSILKFKKIIR